MSESELKRAGDIGYPGAARDQRRAFVDHPVVDFAGGLIVRIGRGDHGTAQRAAQALEDGLVD
jgi:hypothetical protein